MEELNTSMFRFGVGLAYEDRRLRIHLIFPAPMARLDFDMELFLTRLRDIEIAETLRTRDGILIIKTIDKDTCHLIFDCLWPATESIMRRDLGYLHYRDLLAAIHMELNTLRLRSRREEVFRVPKWSRDGGPFW